MENDSSFIARIHQLLQWRVNHFQTNVISHKPTYNTIKDDPLYIWQSNR